VPPFEVAKAMFYQTMSEAEALTYYQELQPDSPQAVWEATRWTVSVDLNSIRMPVMTAVGVADSLVRPSAVEGLANLLRCRYVTRPEIGHSDLLLKGDSWLPIAQDIEQWLISAISGLSRDQAIADSTHSGAQ
jgi:pimeloyl-ACP methyl ester carboxylesterase